MSNVIETCGSTGRIARWRGVIIDVLGRLSIQLKERTLLDETQSREHNEIEALVKSIFASLAKLEPGVIGTEYARLKSLEPITFAAVLPA
jgi:hypothetical protein